MVRERTAFAERVRTPALARDQHLGVDVPVLEPVDDEPDGFLAGWMAAEHAWPEAA